MIFAETDPSCGLTATQEVGIPMHPGLPLIARQPGVQRLARHSNFFRALDTDIRSANKIHPGLIPSPGHAKLPRLRSVKDPLNTNVNH